MGSPSESVSLSSCVQGISPFHSGQKLTSSCVQYGCSSGQCLKTTSPCGGGYKTTHECVGNQWSTDVQPFNFFWLMGVLAFGLFLLIIPRQWEFNNKMMVGTIILLFSVNAMVGAIHIERDCPHGDDEVCVNGKGHQVSSSKCWEGYGVSPFAVNLPPSGNTDCNKKGCDIGQCVQSVTSCGGGKTTYECVGAQGFSYVVNPVAFFFALMTAALGGFLVFQVWFMDPPGYGREPLLGK
eukprot:GFYU01008772.1.p1 GENE.GFYU01008772.1~~GFYU01008772.1.p1  ORF type:complete len:249 (-),score=58.35 GFYU01008772.1:159-872(-)